MNVARETAVDAVAYGSFWDHLERVGPCNALPHTALALCLFPRSNHHRYQTSSSSCRHRFNRHFPDEPELARCPLNSPSILKLRILSGTGLNFPFHSVCFSFIESETNFSCKTYWRPSIGLAVLCFYSKRGFGHRTAKSQPTWMSHTTVD